MSENLVPIIIVPVIFFAFYMVIRTISDNGVRRKIIEKGMVDENVQHLFKSTHREFRPNSLKWGMVLIALGAAILVGQIAPYSFQEEITISAMFILSGLALVVYYIVAAKSGAKSENGE